MKSFFTRYSFVVINLFNTGLCRSTVSIISFGKLVFRYSTFSVFFVLNQDIMICAIII